MVTIGKYPFESPEEWLSWRNSKFYYCTLGILVCMKILIELFPIVLSYSLFNMLKQLRMGSPKGSYGMSEARVVATFQHILAPGFGGNSASVLNFLLSQISGRY